MKRPTKSSWLLALSLAAGFMVTSLAYATPGNGDGKKPVSKTTSVSAKKIEASKQRIADDFSTTDQADQIKLAPPAGSDLEMKEAAQKFAAEQKAKPSTSSKIPTLNKK